MTIHTLIQVSTNYKAFKLDMSCRLCVPRYPYLSLCMCAGTFSVPGAPPYLTLSSPGGSVPTP